MDKVQNVSRYWVYKDSGIIYRQWTDEEYKTIDPHKHIFEKLWCYYCPICNFIPVPCFDKKEATHHSNTHRHYTGHKCVIEYRDFELVCFESRDEFLENLGVWVHKQELY